MATTQIDIENRIEKGIRLFKLRANSRWYSHAQEAFAHHIGYAGTKAASNISRIENGERTLPTSKEEEAAKVLARDPDLVDDWEYLLDFLRCKHSDLRGCLAARPKFRLVEEPSQPGFAGTLHKLPDVEGAPEGAPVNPSSPPTRRKRQMSYYVRLPRPARHRGTCQAVIPRSSRSRSYLQVFAFRTCVRFKVAKS